MSRRDWLRYAGFAAIALGALWLIVRSLFWLWAYQAEHSNERVDAAQYKHDSANGVVLECLSRVDSPNFSEGIICLANAIESNREAKRSEYDLKAQQEMAEWAFGMLLVTGLGLIVTTTGVVFVLQSLRLARKSVDTATTANDLSRKALVADQRAWIKATVGFGSGLTFVETAVFTQVTIQMQNVGQSPALHVIPYVWLTNERADVRIQDEFEQHCAAIKKRRTSLGFTLFPDDTFPVPAGTWQHGAQLNRAQEESGTQLVLLVCVDYVLPTDPGVHHQTRMVYRLARLTDPHHTYRRGGNIPKEELALLDYGMGMGTSAD